MCVCLNIVFQLESKPMTANKKREYERLFNPSQESHEEKINVSVGIILSDLEITLFRY
jgi:hypothetical protein